MKYFFTRAWRKINKTIASTFFLDQWVILTSTNATHTSFAWDDFQPLIPSPDRYWADPFILPRDNHYYIFIEEKLYETGLGRIACLTLDRTGGLLSNQTVLEQPYHLSYPFIFEYQGQTYMLPETGKNHTLGLYRCVHFPDQWIFVKNLMTDIYAVDATLLEYNGKWWLFANVKEQGGSSLDALHLFWADSPLSEKWTAHQSNPIVANIHTARPAGRILASDGKLIRPSQDSSRRYGYALNFNQITRLSETEYDETHLSTFLPPRGKRVLAIHTWNEAEGMTIIDAVIRRRKWMLNA
jgi:hypothetical protein